MLNKLTRTMERRPCNELGTRQDTEAMKMKETVSALKEIKSSVKKQRDSQCRERG